MIDISKLNNIPGFDITLHKFNATNNDMLYVTALSYHFYQLILSSLALKLIINFIVFQVSLMVTGL